MANSNLEGPVEVIDMTGDGVDDDDDLQRAIELSLLEQRSEDSSLGAKRAAVQHSVGISNDCDESFEAAIAASMDTALEERSHRKHRAFLPPPSSSLAPRSGGNSPTSQRSNVTRRIGTVPGTPKSLECQDEVDDDGRTGSKRVCLDHMHATQQKQLPHHDPTTESEESAQTASVVDRHVPSSPVEQAQEPAQCTSGGQGQFSTWSGNQAAGPAMNLRRFYRSQRVLWRCIDEVYEAVVSSIDSRSCPLLYTLDLISPAAPNKTVETTAHDLLLYLEPGERVWCRLRVPADVAERGDGTDMAVDAEGVKLGAAAEVAAAEATGRGQAVDSGSTMQLVAGSNPSSPMQIQADRCMGGDGTSAPASSWEEAEVISTDLSHPDPQVCLMPTSTLDLSLFSGRLPPAAVVGADAFGEVVVLLLVPMSDVELYHGVGECSSSTQCLPLPDTADPQVCEVI